MGLFNKSCFHPTGLQPMGSSLQPNISIVSCFFDIGRGEWNGPSYLKRTTDEYFERFERLLKLENQIIVFTSDDLVYRFKNYKKQKSNLRVVGLYNWQLIWEEFRPRINDVFNNPLFQSMIQQPWNPEYWSVDYVMVNMLKSWFVNKAIEYMTVENDLLAWIDFGYARKDEDIPTTIWNYPFDSNKITLFTIKPNLPTSMNIYDIISINDVIITGCHIVGGKKSWKDLENLVYNNIDRLLNASIIDDDQSILFMSYLEKPNEFDVKFISSNDWFQIFRNFNIMKGNEDL